MKRSPSSRSWWLSYPIWLILCAILFVSLRGMDDPSRPSHRLESDEAATLALEHARSAMPGRFEDYDVVHVSRASGRSGEGDPRWMVVADRRERTRLREAILIELEIVDGSLIDVKRIDAVTATAAESLLEGRRAGAVQ